MKNYVFWHEIEYKNTRIFEMLEIFWTIRLFGQICNVSNAICRTMNSLEKKNKNKLSLRGILRLLTFPFWLSYAIIKLLKQVTATAKLRAFRKTSYWKATSWKKHYLLRNMTISKKMIWKTSKPFLWKDFKHRYRFSRPKPSRVLEIIWFAVGGIVIVLCFVI